MFPIAAGSVHLPATADIGNPRAAGTSLEFIQPDGTVIVIPGGAIAGFTLFVGDVAIPADALAALLEAQGIQPAAGPASGNNAHGSFEAPGQQTVGQGEDFVSGLLADSDALEPQGPGPATDFGEANLPPVLFGVGTAALDEAMLGKGTVAAGSLATSDSGPLAFACRIFADARVPRHAAENPPWPSILRLSPRSSARHDVSGFSSA